MRKILASFRIAILAGMVITAMAYFLRREIMQLPQLPTVKFWEPALKSKLLDRNGRVVFEYAVEKREYAPFHLIPRPMVQAAVAIEDDRFYQHWGIDLEAILRAMWANLTKGRVVQGGSTITQQLAKNLFLTREKTLQRKIDDQLLAVYMEKTLSKDEIMEMYLNRVYLGHGVYGVGEGALVFLGKPLAEISLAEAALLAGLIQRPASYSPWEKPKSAKGRARIVLRRMHEIGMISSSTYAASSIEEIQIASRAVTTLPPAFAHFIEYIRQDIEERYSPEALWKGGLKIETTIDAGQQEKAYLILTQALEKFDLTRLEWEKSRKLPEHSTSTVKIEGAFLAVEAKTGSILVWLGGREFKVSQLNRVYQAKRPPGSAFKPFVWLAALAAGANPSSVYEDLPIAYTYDGRSWRLVPGSTDFYQIHLATASLPQEMAWVPENFDEKYYGRISLRRALALSRNLVSVRLVDQVGPAQIIELAHKAGIQSRLDRVLSLGLGTSVVSLLELVSSYQTLANSGVHAAPYAISRITQISTGEMLEENRPQLAAVLDPALVYAVVDMMKSVVTEGTARSIGRRVRRPMAGKTGTTQDNRDLWFVGFTPEVAAGGWMGYDNNESIGKKDVTGGSTVGPWWGDIMASIVQDYRSRDFGSPPEGVSFNKVCMVSGKLARASCPKTRLELFLKQNVPSDFCRLMNHEQEVLLKPDVIPGTTGAMVISSTEAVPAVAPPETPAPAEPSSEQNEEEEEVDSHDED